MSITRIRIAELLHRTNIADSDIMIVEDDIDTKQSTILELKRAFLGDALAPQNYKFYSSKKVDDIVAGLKIILSDTPKKAEFDSLKQQLANIIGGTGEGKDPEVVGARGTYPTLAERLDGDLAAAEEKYIQFPEEEASTNTIDLSDIEYAKIQYSTREYDQPTKVLITGINKYTHTKPEYNNVTLTDTGLKLVYTRAQNTFNIPIGSTVEPGQYYLYADVSTSEDFVREGTVIKFIHTDGTSTISDFVFSNVMTFEISKSIREFQILPNIDTIVDNMWLQLDNLMISDKENITKYYPYSDESIDVPANAIITETKEIVRSKLSRTNGLLEVKVLDTSYTGTKIKNEIESLKDYIYNPEDYCGLLENPGTYIYASETLKIDTPQACSKYIDQSKFRNGHPSVKINILDFSEDYKPEFTMVLPNVADFTDNSMISIQLYIDKTVSEKFSEDDGIKVMISGDETIANPATNYIYFYIGKRSFVQGWNTIKLKIADFKIHGNPNLKTVSQINFRVFSSEFIEGKCLWMNSVIIDQRMKPTILFAFDGFSETGFEYQYPYLYSRDIPVTIFANNKRTLTQNYMQQICMLHYQYGWELAEDGCNPNKEQMIQDDNPRNQYIAIKDQKDWFSDNFTTKISSYSAPFGNLRPITEPILREFGFNMCKETADAYCSLFTKHDFSIPMHMLSNADGCTSQRIKDKIDEIIDMGQVLCIYTGDVTKYGDEISAKKTEFEIVIDYVKKYVDTGVLQCMTFSEFYDKCTVK